MSLFDDLFGTLSDVGSSALDRVPWARKAYDEGKTWIVGAARSQPWLLDVVTNAVALPALLPIVGPAATALWAAPGIVKGEPFSQAYVEGFTKRLVQLAQYLAGQGASEALQKQATDAFASQVQQVSSDPALQQTIVSIAREQTNEAVRDALVQAHLTPEEIAARFGVRPDAAAFALDLLLKKKVYDPSEFQIPDGKRVFIEDPAEGPLKSSAEYLTLLNVAKSQLISLQQAQAQGVPNIEARTQRAADEVRRLRDRYETAISQEDPPKDATFWLDRLIQAKAAGAPPATVAALQRNLNEAVSRQNLKGEGMVFQVRQQPPMAFGKPSAGQVVADVVVVGFLLYAVSVLARE